MYEVRNRIIRKILLSLILITSILFVFGCDREEATEETNGGEVELIDDYIFLATTTSTYDSGLLDYINPVFTEKTGLEVHVVSQGTGAALENGSRGDADALLVHDRVSELQMVEDGVFVDRYDVMYNDFIIVGPEDDPAGLLGVENVTDALKLIADGELFFVSRGDDSGTHRMEMRLWDDAGIKTEGQGWYLSVGQGMGDTLNMANEEMGYAMTDRGTYVYMKEKLDLVIVLEGDPILFNQYGVMAVNQEKHPEVKYDYAKMYIDFLMSDEGQSLINAYKVNGETLFFSGYGLE